MCFRNIVLESWPSGIWDCLCNVIGSVFGKRSQQPYFEFLCWQLWKVFHHLITFGGRLAYLAYHGYKSSRETPVKTISSLNMNSVVEALCVTFVDLCRDYVWEMPNIFHLPVAVSLWRFISFVFHSITVAHVHTDTVMDDWLQTCRVWVGLIWCSERDRSLNRSDM